MDNVGPTENLVVGLHVGGSIPPSPKYEENDHDDYCDYQTDADNYCSDMLDLNRVHWLVQSSASNDLKSTK